VDELAATYYFIRRLIPMLNIEHAAGKSGFFRS
jgi:hypothetical protein